MNELTEAQQYLEGAKQYLQSVKDEFKNEPDLLAFYEPSAIQMVRFWESELNIRRE